MQSSSFPDELDENGLDQPQHWLDRFLSEADCRSTSLLIDKENSELQSYC